jgi:AraC-like DNA-binding protein
MLLAENKLSITQVAFEAGFCGSSHFASAFQKRFGISPSAFRTGKSRSTNQ